MKYACAIVLLSVLVFLPCCETRRQGRRGSTAEDSREAQRVKGDKGDRPKQATRRRCQEGYYECGSGHCLAENRVCDRHSDCPDGSDEVECPCRSDEFQCINGDCIPQSEHCDKTYDCRDGSDELDCHDVPTEPRNVQVHALSPTSIKMTWDPPVNTKDKITGYRIRYKKKGDRIGSTISTNGNILEYTLQDLLIDTDYQVRMSALTLTGSSPLTEWLYIKTYADELNDTETDGTAKLYTQRSTLTGSDGFILVRHSQSTDVPVCPESMTTLWEGYSLVNTEGNGKSSHHDLGLTDSCIQRFSTMPFMMCNINNVCHYASRSDKSYWLSTNAPMPMMPVDEGEIVPYISRCTVCEAVSNVIAVHSQRLEIPDCPLGWTGIWIGYSFLKYTGAGMSGGGQSLSNPGSCLEEFRTIPFIECNERGQCMYFTNHNSYWMTVIGQNSQFSTPLSETLKGGDLRSRVSRCQVCQKHV